jgi:hypothetical protein
MEEKESKYWTDVLTRVVAIVKFLADRAGFSWQQ